MRHYEIMLLIHPDRSDQVSSIVKRYTQLIQSTHGVIHRLEDLGRRTLAYPIKKLNKAYYVLFNIECAANTQQELKDSIAFNDAIIRCLNIRRIKAITESSVLSKAQSKTTAQTPSDDTRPPKAVADDKSLKDENKAVVDIDYKNAEFLAKHYLTDTKKIARRRVTRANAKQQHRLGEAIKRARLVGLLPHCDKYEQPELS